MEVVASKLNLGRVKELDLAYESRRFSTWTGLEDASRIFTLERGLDVDFCALLELPDRTGYFMVFEVGWLDPGQYKDPAFRLRESWVLNPRTKRALDWASGVCPVLVRLVVQPGYHQVYSWVYDDRFMELHEDRPHYPWNILAKTVHYDREKTGAEIIRIGGVPGWSHHRGLELDVNY